MVQDRTVGKYNNILFTYPGVSKHNNGETANLAEAQQLHRQSGVQAGNHLRRWLLQIGVAGKPEQPSKEHHHQ